MERDRRKVQSKKRKEEGEEENILQETLKLLESLFEARLIERIARPSDRKVREELIERYGNKLEELHLKLEKIKKETAELGALETGTANVGKKSVMGEATRKPGDWRRAIRSIEGKYIEVLVDGSYKFFRKVAASLQLGQSRNMELINIEEWASTCLDTRQGDICC